MSARPQAWRPEFYASPCKVSGYRRGLKSALRQSRCYCLYTEQRPQSSSWGAFAPPAKAGKLKKQKPRRMCGRRRARVHPSRLAALAPQDEASRPAPIYCAPSRAGAAGWF